jgi:hypothetical protein
MCGDQAYIANDDGLHALVAAILEQAMLDARDGMEDDEYYDARIFIDDLRLSKEIVSALHLQLSTRPDIVRKPSTVKRKYERSQPHAKKIRYKRLSSFGQIRKEYEERTEFL